ncbi:MAG: hypothetical protein M3Z23_03875, partial [Acidobacteriota bacterium]|nr:hypothetical protein [Acidobacteriota bacterium]
MKNNPSISSSRRGFVRATIGAAALSAASVKAAKRPLEPLSPGMKISYQLGSNFTNDDLIFAKQI